MRLSTLLEKTGLEEYARIYNEQDFDLFAPITTAVSGEKCIFLQNEKWINFDRSMVSMLITTQELSERLRQHRERNDDIGLCVTENPRGLFFELLNYYESVAAAKRIPTTIGRDCEIAKTARISSNDVCIGDHVIIEDYVMIGPRVSIGRNTVIRSG